MQCRSCGHSLSDRARFCSQCGAEQTPRCPQCGADVARGDRFCEQCGAAVQGASPVSAGAQGEPSRPTVEPLAVPAPTVTQVLAPVPDAPPRAEVPAAQEGATAADAVVPPPPADPEPSAQTRRQQEEELFARARQRAEEARQRELERQAEEAEQAHRRQMEAARLKAEEEARQREAERRAAEERARVAAAEEEARRQHEAEAAAQRRHEEQREATRREIDAAAAEALANEEAAARRRLQSAGARMESSTAVRPAVAPRQDTPETRPEATPTISGPSFLGLSNGTPATGGDVSYLVDEEAPRRSPWRFVALLFVLAVVGALAWAQWRYGLPNLYHRYVDGRQTEEQPQTNPSASQPATPAATSDQPAGEASKTGGAGAPTSSAPAANAPRTPPNQTTDLPVNGAPARTENPTLTPAPATNNAPSAPSGGGIGAPAPPADGGARGAGAANTESNHGPGTAKALPPRTLGDRDPLLVKARQYLQGRGVPKSCSQGLKYLTAAADQPNPEARVQLGALYMSGTCVPQDRRAAYRWFSRALELDPNNEWTRRNRETVWAQMTPAERQSVGATP